MVAILGAQQQKQMSVLFASHNGFPNWGTILLLAREVGSPAKTTSDRPADKHPCPKMYPVGGLVWKGEPPTC